MKILIVDDHEIVTYGVKKFIQEHHPDYILRTAADSSFLDLASDDHPDLVILDVEYPEMDVFEIIRRIRRKWSDCSIIIYTIHQEAGLLRRLLDAGVDDIVLKSSSIDVLLQSIESVAIGECPKPDTTVADIVKKFDDCPRLTGAEQKVLNLIRQGYSSCEMANLLSVSENTIESHRRHLLRKLGARNVADLIVKAQKAGW